MSGLIYLRRRGLHWARKQQTPKSWCQFQGFHFGKDLQEPQMLLITHSHAHVSKKTTHCYCNDGLGVREDHPTLTTVVLCSVYYIHDRWLASMPVSLHHHAFASSPASCATLTRSTVQLIFFFSQIFRQIGDGWKNIFLSLSKFKSRLNMYWFLVWFWKHFDRV